MEVLQEMHPSILELFFELRESLSQKPELNPSRIEIGRGHHMQYHDKILFLHKFHVLLKSIGVHLLQLRSQVLLNFSWFDFLYFL